MNGKLSSYIEKVLGLKFGDKGSVTLPVPYCHYFTSRHCEIDGKDFYLLRSAVADVKRYLLLDRVKKTEAATGVPCILVLDDINNMDRRELIGKRVNFIVPDKQIYIPVLGMFLTETGQSTQARKSETFSPAAQLILLYHLQRESLEGLKMSDVSERLGYPLKTISLAVSELKDAGVCSIKSCDGRTRQIVFNYSGQDLWNHAVNRLTSPIQKAGYISKDRIADTYPVSGEPALAHYTDVGGTSMRCVAIERRSQIGKALAAKLTDSEFENCIRVELWKYNPDTLAADGYVGPLSLTLCYKDDDDERVQGQLERLIERTL